MPISVGTRTQRDNGLTKFAIFIFFNFLKLFIFSHVYKFFWFFYYGIFYFLYFLLNFNMVWTYCMILI
jgi:hypothetical protein